MRFLNRGGVRSKAAFRGIKVSLALLTFFLLCQCGGVLAQVPGIELPADTELSGGRPGSVLFYNYFTSGIDTLAENTIVSITNTNSSTSVLVRLIFINGISRNAGSLMVSLGGHEEQSLRVSDFLPESSGYIIAVAVNATTGCPVRFNHLIGNALIKRSTGHSATLTAVAVPAVAASPASCGSVNTALNFDGVSYGRLPRVLSLTGFGSTADGNSTLVILNRIQGDLSVGGAGAEALSSTFGLSYDDTAQSASFIFSRTGSQLQSVISNDFPLTSPRTNTRIPAGRTGWIKLYTSTDIAHLGASINFNSGAAGTATRFNDGQNLAHMTLSSAGAVTIPRAFPDLTISRSHTGNFRVGVNGSYTVVVGNAGDGPAGGLLGETRVIETLPANMTLASFSGTGWSCSGTGTSAVVCTNATTLNPGGQLSPLTLTVSIGEGAPGSISGQTSVENYQEPPGNRDDNTTFDTTTILASCKPNFAISQTLPSRPIGSPYDLTITQSNGNGSVSYELISGTLPAGVSLNSTGIFSGTPTALGSHSFTVKATDSAFCSIQQNYSVNIYDVYEADTSPRPYGDGQVSVNDWVQVGRFVVTLDGIGGGNEPLRADTAPRQTGGDGNVDVLDWVQAGRYVVGLDQLTTSLMSRGDDLPALMGEAVKQDPEPERLLRLGSKSAGKRKIVEVSLEARGGEAALSFSLGFDPRQLRFESAEGGPGFQVMLQKTQLDQGRLGVVMAMAPGERLPEGSHEVIRLNFSGDPRGTVVPGDGPMPLVLANLQASALPVRFSVIRSRTK